MSLPGELTGTWRRVALAVGGRRLDPGMDVLWLQGDEWYADIRLRTGEGAADDLSEVAGGWDREWAFAGPARWDPPRMTWTHVFDSTGPDAGADAGDLSWEGDVLVETGTTTAGTVPLTYREDWARLDDRPADVERRGDGVTVTAGGWCIDITAGVPGGAFTADRRRFEESGWVNAGGLVVPGPEGIGTPQL